MVTPQKPLTFASWGCILVQGGTFLDIPVTNYHQGEEAALMPTGASTMSEQVYTIEEAARVLKVSHRTIRRMIDTGELPSFRVRTGIRIRRAVIDAMMMRDTGPTKAVHPPDEEEVE